jgi:ABC-2 type transport system permease protein
MKKYLYAFKFEVMTTLQYAFNFIGKMFSLFLMIFVFMNLWNFMYDDPSQAINGYTKFQMIWYVSISELIYFITRGRQTCEEISRHIKNGNIAYTINKPYDYVVYTLFTLLGRSFVSSAFYTAFIMIIGSAFTGSLPALTSIELLGVILVFALAITISLLLVIAIGLFSFIFEDSSPMYWIYSKIWLICGTLFPIEFFPVWAQNILKFTPIYVITGPSRLIVNFNTEAFVQTLIAQGIYLVFAFGLCELVYRKGMKKLNVNGG